MGDKVKGVKCTEEIMKKCKYCPTARRTQHYAKEHFMCEYLLKTYKRRPCPPENCTVFEEVKDNGRKQR